MVCLSSLEAALGNFSSGPSTSPENFAAQLLTVANAGRPLDSPAATLNFNSQQRGNKLPSDWQSVAQMIAGMPVASGTASSGADYTAQLPFISQPILR